jgi:ribosomal silencing factor RsfS
MFKRVKRKPENSMSWRTFVNRVRYITNQGHPHHKIKKVVLAAVNFACVWGQKAKDFIRAVHESQDTYKVLKQQRKGGGNPTEDIFFELVYSAPKWIRTRPEERDAIDKIITAPFRNCPIRRGWHLAAWDLDKDDRPEKWKPLDDAHYLISARDNFGKATISSRFGDGRETLESWMLRVDDQICALLNQTREKQYEPVRPIYIRRLQGKLGHELTKLHKMIADHTAKPITRKNLAEVIEEMKRPSTDDPDEMVPVAKVTNADRTLLDVGHVLVHFTARKEHNKYRIRKLLLNIANTQLDIELARPKGHEDHGGGAGGNAGLPTPAEAPTKTTQPSSLERVAKDTGQTTMEDSKPARQYFKENKPQVMPKAAPAQNEPAMRPVPIQPPNPQSSHAQPKPSKEAHDLRNPSADVMRARERSIRIAKVKYKKRSKKRESKEPGMERE